MQRATFWSRMGHWFRPSTKLTTEEGDPMAGDGPIVSGELVMTEPSGAASKFRLNRSAAVLERLEEDHARVVRLIEAVQTHLQQQGERGESVAQSLARLAESLEHLPEASKTQLEALVAIGQRLEADGASFRRVEENLTQLPRIADAQRETMVSIGRQLDLSRQTSDKVGVTLDGFQQAVTLLGEATSASARALQDMRGESASREQRVASILEEQTRRLTMFAIAAVSLAALAAVVAVVALVKG